VLTGGELPALVILDAVVRLLPGVLGNEASAGEETFDEGLLEYPHYTRPAEFRGRAVPDVLLSGTTPISRGGGGSSGWCGRARAAPTCGPAAAAEPGPTRS
jgi:hypothetical protein